MTIKFYFNFLKRIFIIYYNIGCKDTYINKNIHNKMDKQQGYIVQHRKI